MIIPILAVIGLISLFGKKKVYYVDPETDPNTFDVDLAKLSGTYQEWAHCLCGDRWVPAEYLDTELNQPCVICGHSACLLEEGLVEDELDSDMVGGVTLKRFFEYNTCERGFDTVERVLDPRDKKDLLKMGMQIQQAFDSNSYNDTDLEDLGMEELALDSWRMCGATHNTAEELVLEGIYPW